MTDLALFDDRGEPTAAARNTDPQTSHDAAKSVRAANLRKSQEAVLEVLGWWGPCTDVDLIRRYHGSIHVSSNPQSESGIRTRRHELVLAGRVVDTGDRVKLDSGRRAIVWAAA